jgi:hypothetical protein
MVDLDDNGDRLPDSLAWYGEALMAVLQCSDSKALS